MDALNTAASNVVLKQRLESMTAELRDKDGLIQRYEQETRRRNDELEKKEHSVSVLNRKLDAMKERAGLDAARAQQADEEEAGPLEATIRELRAELDRKAAESAEMQRQWISGQTELVARENDNASKGDTLLELRARLTILNQKRLRIESQFDVQNREVVELERSMSMMHHQLTKLNALIAKHRALRERLADDNHTLEEGFVHRLAQMEGESLQAEAQVVALAAEKERLLTEVAESERETMLWEKKIALERETQAALDPEVGASEVKAMQKEIHRMKLRFSQLKKREELMLAEMERAIYKRDNIEAKGRTSSLRASGETQASLKKAVTDLSTKLKLTTHDANVTLVNVQRLRERQATVAADLDTLNARRRELLAQEESLHAVRARAVGAASVVAPRRTARWLRRPSARPARGARLRARAPCALRALPTRTCRAAAPASATAFQTLPNPTPQTIQTQEIERAFHETEAHKNQRVRARAHAPRTRAHARACARAPVDPARARPLAPARLTPRARAAPRTHGAPNSSSRRCSAR